MRAAAEAKAKTSNSAPPFAGKFDGDDEGQVAAIENLIAAGAKGILLVPSDSKAIVPTVEKARKAGILVITLDTLARSGRTPPTPTSAPTTTRPA